MHTDIRIQTQDFDIAAEWAACRERCGGDCGAIVAFGGLVRDRFGDNTVQALHLEHYPGMTEDSIRRIVEQAGERWRLLNVVVVHRVGDLAANEQIVLVLAASGHRPDAFAACEFIMDYLKTDAVFWKKERRQDGDVWIESTASDRNRRESWGEVTEPTNT
ncbi:MAG: molybdenum cofactor biosynthesis protein MoaE [Gammaproteobacteria bacterium]|nr:molybdenum cofactor biosynthesis protein MoaE [Gammaproteobacteria bacterium]